MPYPILMRSQGSRAAHVHRDLDGPSDLSPELKDDAEIRYRDMLVMVLGSEAEVVAACIAHDQVVDGYPDEALPLGRTEEEKAAVSRWWSAEPALLGAPWRVTAIVSVRRPRTAGGPP